MILIVALVFPFVAWAVCYAILSFPAYEMDHDSGSAKGTFYPLLILYSAFFYVIAGLGVLGYTYGKSPLFLLASGEALLWNIRQLVEYEGYLHSRYSTGQSPYTRSKYAWTWALGYSAILTLIAGVAVAFRVI